jgi:ribose transport system ATP-binding protein
MESEFDQSVAALGITPANRQLPVAAFSGGNQQKLLLSKWLLDTPSVIVLHEPVQAVDVGAREDILAAIRGAADNGAAVILSSIEAEDLARVCDRVIVLRQGRLHTELSGNNITPSAIVGAMYGDRPLQEQLL